MNLRFEPSGTHVQKGYLKIRLDLMPDVADKTYVLHHVEMPVIPPGGYPGKVDEWGNPLDTDDFDKWLEGLPKVWQLNPMLCHFVKVDADITKAQLAALKGDLFDGATLTHLDDTLSVGGDVRDIMRTKLGTGKPVGDVDIGAINDRLREITTRGEVG